MVVDLYGLVGIVIAATVPYFVATQLHTKTSRHLTAERIRVLLGVLAAATTTAAVGAATTNSAATRTGFSVYAAAVIALLVFIPTVGRRQRDFAGPRAAGLAAGIAWWVAVTVALAIMPWTVTGVVALMSVSRSTVQSERPARVQAVYRSGCAANRSTHANEQNQYSIPSYRRLPTARARGTRMRLTGSTLWPRTSWTHSISNNSTAAETLRKS